MVARERAGRGPNERAISSSRTTPRELASAAPPIRAPRPGCRPMRAPARPRCSPTGWCASCSPARRRAASSASPSPRPPPPTWRSASSSGSALGHARRGSLGKELTELEGERPTPHQQSAARPPPLRPRGRDAGRPEDRDHPRLLRAPAAPRALRGQRARALRVLDESQVEEMLPQATKRAGRCGEWRAPPDLAERSTWSASRPPAKR